MKQHVHTRLILIVVARNCAIVTVLVYGHISRTLSCSSSVVMDVTCNKLTPSALQAASGANKREMWLLFLLVSCVRCSSIYDEFEFATGEHK